MKPSLRSRVLDIARAFLEPCGIAALSRPGLHGLDRKLARHLDFRDGFFVEAGAHDGFQQSNTYYLARFRGWKGILIEPLPALAAQCRKRRKESRIVAEALVSPDREGAEVTLRYAGLMTLVKGSLASDELEEEHVRNGFRLQQLEGDPSEEITVPARTLDVILEEARAPANFDLLSLDVEGYEAEALRGLDLDRFQPRFICIEVFHENDDAVRALLEPRYELREVLYEHEQLYRDLLFIRRSRPAPRELPGVSVVVANHNNGPFLRACLDSILTQTIVPDAIIVVDDASTDDSRRILAEYQDRHANIRCLFNESRLGVAESRNRGLDEVTTPFVSTLDSDDFYFSPMKLERELALVCDRPESRWNESAAFSDTVWVDGDGRFLRNAAADSPVREGRIFEAMSVRRAYIPRDILFPISAYAGCGGFDRSLEPYEDLDFKLRLAKALEFHDARGEGTAYRQHGGGLSACHWTEHVRLTRRVYVVNRPRDQGLGERLANDLRFYAWWLRQLIWWLRQ